MDLVTLEAFQPHLLSIIPQISGTLNNLIDPAMLEDLPWLFPKLLTLSAEKANFICATVLNPDSRRRSMCVARPQVSDLCLRRFVCSVAGRVHAEGDH
jgi:hypothetical protein